MLGLLVVSCTAALAAASSVADTPRFELADHPTIRFSENTFILGRMRWDYEHRGPRESLDYASGDIAFRGKDSWGFVRRRLAVEGNVGGKLAYEIETDLTGPERWKDVYAEYMEHRPARVRAGKFVIPFSYERTTSIDVLDFAYRSMGATLLVPPRDRGVMLFGDLAGRKVTYETGWFEDGDTLAGRITVRPIAGLETGAAITYGKLGDEMSPLRGSTALGVPFFWSERFDSGHRRRQGAWAAYRAGSAALKAEYIGNRDLRDAGAPLRADAWYVSASYVLTGESESSAHQPKRPLFRGGIGSVEVAARAEEIRFVRGPGSGLTAKAQTLGVNWQPHRWFRVQWNAIHDVLPWRRMWTRVLRFHLTI